MIRLLPQCMVLFLIFSLASGCKTTFRATTKSEVKLQTEVKNDSIDSLNWEFYVLAYTLYDHATLGTPVAGDIQNITGSMALAASDSDIARRLDEMESRLNGLSSNSANNTDEIDALRAEMKKELNDLRAKANSAVELAKAADAAAKKAEDRARRMASSGDKPSSNNGGKVSAEFSAAILKSIDAMESQRNKPVEARKTSASKVAELLRNYRGGCYSFNTSFQSFYASYPNLMQYNMRGTNGGCAMGCTCGSSENYTYLCRENSGSVYRSSEWPVECYTSGVEIRYLNGRGVLQSNQVYLMYPGYN